MTRFRTTLAVLFALLAGPAQAAGGGHVRCAITENGESAQGTLRLAQGEKEVSRGACGSEALSVPAGDYTAVIQLDGALDGPEERKSVAVRSGQVAEVSADFATGILEVRIQNDGRRAAGMALIRRGGTQVGTLGSGVSAHLSAGTYEVVARYRDQEQRFEDVVVKSGDKRTIDVSFGSAANK